MSDEAEEIPEEITGLQWIPAGDGGQLLVWEGSESTRYHLDSFEDLPDEHRVRRIVEEEGGPGSVVSWQAVDAQGPE